MPLQKILFFMFLAFGFQKVYAQKVSGKVFTENEVPVSLVLVFNLKTEEKSYSDLNGNFEINASFNDELRFVKAGYERSSVKVSSFLDPISVRLNPSLIEIEEIELNSVRLSGNINKDSKSLTKNDRVERLRKDIGLPKPPEKPREKPAEVGKDVLLPVLLGQLNVQALYDVISGDARRMKALYKFEDLQSDILWIRKRIDVDYFTKAGMPEKKIQEFLEFSFTENPKIRKYAQAKNLSGVMIELEPVFEIYLKRINN